jgi:hypothetical protein
MSGVLESLQRRAVKEPYWVRVYRATGNFRVGCVIITARGPAFAYVAKYQFAGGCPKILDRCLVNHLVAIQDFVSVLVYFEQDCVVYRLDGDYVREMWSQESHEDRRLTLKGGTVTDYYAVPHYKWEQRSGVQSWGPPRVTAEVAIFDDQPANTPLVLRATARQTAPKQRKYALDGDE